MTLAITLDEVESLMEQPFRVREVEGTHFCRPSCIHISEVEQRVIEDVCNDMSTQAMALKEKVAFHTIKNRLADLYLKLHVWDRPSLVVFAFRSGMVK